MRALGSSFGRRPVDGQCKRGLRGMERKRGRRISSRHFMVFALLLALLLAAAVLFLSWRQGRIVRHRRKAPSPEPATADPTPTEAPTRGRRKPDWVRAEVLRLKAITDASVRNVANNFNRLYGERMTVGRTFVAELFRAHRYEIACLTRDIRSRPPTPCRVNAVWALDFTFQTDVHGKTHAALGLIDHGSRLLLGLKRVTHRNAWTVLGHLCLSIGRYGRPRAVRMDNEAVFKSKLLRRALKLFRIRRQFTRPHSPWRNGRIERLFGTLKPLLRKLALPNGAALDRALFEFRLFYNHIRAHQNLGGRTPAEAWATRGDREPLPSVRGAKLVSALGGLLVGYYLRR